MVKLGFVLSLFSMFFSFTSYSHCNGNSCWSIVNNSSSPLSINCVGYGEVNFFTKESLAVGQRFSKQYDTGWGDGLGYPEPNVWFSCTLEAGAKKASLSFSTIFWGDEVRFTAQNQKIELLQLSPGQQKQASVPWSF